MIKYYGGKTRLVKTFEKYLPTKDFENIVDLFVGGDVALNYYRESMV